MREPHRIGAGDTFSLGVHGPRVELHAAPRTSVRLHGAVALIASDLDGTLVAGTAFGVSPSGLLVTNRHVVQTQAGATAAGPLREAASERRGRLLDRKKRNACRLQESASRHPALL